MAKKKKRRRILPVILFFSIVFGILYYLLPFNTIVGDSMGQTLSHGTLVVSEKVSYMVGKPQRSEIVMYRRPDAANGLFVGRVIGIPGDKVNILYGDLYLNEKKLQEDYLSKGVLTSLRKTDKLTPGVFTVPANNYVILGDNRDKSEDSRVFGTIPKDLIQAKFLYKVK